MLNWNILEEYNLQEQLKSKSCGRVVLHLNHILHMRCAFCALFSPAYAVSTNTFEVIYHAYFVSMNNIG